MKTKQKQKRFSKKADRDLGVIVSIMYYGDVFKHGGKIKRYYT